VRPRPDLDGVGGSTEAQITAGNHVSLIRTARSAILAVGPASDSSARNSAKTALIPGKLRESKTIPEPSRTGTDRHIPAHAETFPRLTQSRRSGRGLEDRRGAGWNLDRAAGSGVAGGAALAAFAGCRPAGNSFRLG
jgi:hypothetical protein